MKRSEMINIIADELSKTYAGGNYEEMAVWILDKLESKGMKPPENKEKSWEILPNGVMTYEVNEWEPEYE